MDPILLTPRLKLTLVEKAERGSQEFNWLHELRSDKDATWWSILRRSETTQDTEKHLKNLLPQHPEPGREKSYRINYAVHEILPSNPSSTTKLIGLVSLRSLDPGRHLVLPEQLLLPSSSAADTLTVEIAYMFLPGGWGKGYATEAINAMFAACGKAKDFWTPYEKVYVRSVVNEANSRSLRVMEKTGMERKGVFVWKAEKEEEAVWVAGQVRTTDRLVIWGRPFEIER